MGSKKPKGKFEVTAGSTGDKLPHSGSESHGGPNYQVSFVSRQYFTIYPISKVHYHFFQSLLTPEGVAGGVSLTRGLFWGPYLMSIAAIKSICPCSLFRVNCLFPVYGGVFPSAYSFWSKRGIWFKI